jgi:alpha-galactosidase
MIKRIGDSFILDTESTTYAFSVMETGQLEHLYYGRHITVDTDTAAITEKHRFLPGNTNAYDGEHNSYTLEDVCLEMSSYGKGDIREPFVEIIYPDGSGTSDFVFADAAIGQGKDEFKTLPGSYDDEGNVEELKITLKDRNSDLILELFYYVYEKCDVITRCSRLVNNGENDVTIKRIMSFMMDLPDSGYTFTTFNGAWAREMKRWDTKVSAGKLVNSSVTGTSSNRANPFCMLHRANTTEDHGECFGLNLIYSGNHYEACEVSSYGKTRLVAGINPQMFSWKLKAGEDFETPEAVLSYSKDGFNGLSQNMHTFVREHIVRGEWKKKPRPVLLNSWEAAYFDINEKKLLNLAKAGADVGIELFVMDDGWFGERNDDTSSLGDWRVNRKKLPNGLDGLCRKINALGLDFGIWVEPEMVNVKSRLYEKHPDWVISIPGKAHSEGRNQRILDLGRVEVQDYIIKCMSRVFSSADIKYVKWDMNRTFTDYFSVNLPAERQGEVSHRYVMGLCRCMKVLTERFPHILFEGCSAGGNRFDLGILCYFPQIWASDDTDAVCRSEIQTGYSYGYPMSVLSAHVSGCPNHQTLRTTPLETRFNVAAFGICGYECNLCDMDKDELKAIKEQILLYKEWREVLQTGDFYRGRTFFEASDGSVLSAHSGNITEWTCVSKDKKRAVGMIFQKMVAPNTQYEYYRAKGLDENIKYHFYNRKLKYNVKNFGDLVNTVSPVHIKQDSIAHNVIAKIVKMDGETEDCMAYGDTLMYSGVKLAPAFGGTGYDGDVRYFQDFGSRLYLMREIGYERSE